MAFDRADAEQVTLLRDSKSRWGIAIGETPAGVSITKIGTCDALPSGGQLDERARLQVGDLVLRVDSVPLVDERGRPVDMPLDDVKGLIKAAGEYLTELVASDPLAEDPEDWDDPSLFMPKAAANINFNWLCHFLHDAAFFVLEFLQSVRGFDSATIDVLWREFLAAWQ